MMTKYECAQQFLKLESLPPKQLDNLEVLERQILDVGLRFYTSKIVNLDDLSLEGAKEKLKELASSVHFLAKMLLVAGCDIHHFRAVSLAHFIEVPPEMQIDDIISRLTTRSSDAAHNDAIGNVVYGDATFTKKEKEEGKEKIPPHPPIEKGQEESEKNACSTRAREDRYYENIPEEELPPEFREFFLTFWELYPHHRRHSRKRCRGKLYSRYDKLKKPENKKSYLDKVLAGLKAHVDCNQWKWCRVIPNAETWINQERWDDEAPNDTSESRRKVSGVSQTANVKSNRAKGLW